MSPNKSNHASGANWGLLFGLLIAIASTLILLGSLLSSHSVDGGDWIGVMNEEGTSLAINTALAVSTVDGSMVELDCGYDSREEFEATVLIVAVECGRIVIGDRLQTIRPFGSQPQEYHGERHILEFRVPVETGASIKYVSTPHYGDDLTVRVTFSDGRYKLYRMEFFDGIYRTF